MKDFTQYFETNKSLWNKKVDIHPDTELYDNDSFKKGRNSLMPIELEELGDVSGKSILHLQCHFGQDTISWTRLGAKATGVDFSEKAIDFAQKMTEELELDTQFVCSNIYDLPQHLDEKFDIVFTSYGTIGWLPDLDKWAAVVSHFLKPNGTFYIVEFHPIIWSFEQDEWKTIGYSYFNDGVISEINTGTYADREADIVHTEHGWNHPTSEVLNALIQAGIQIEHFNEFPYSPYDVFPNMEEIEKGKYVIKHFQGMIPYVFSIKGQKIVPQASLRRKLLP
jgi:ubiquinone/menaquinone biosynthesis C-methylase UbiE